MKEYEDILKMIDKNEVVIVGAGIGGKYMLARLKRDKIDPLYIMDNNKELEGKSLNDTQIIKPKKVSENCLYIICVRNPQYIKELYEQLISLGIDSENIIIEKYFTRTYEYMKSLKEEDYQKEIDAIYFECFDKLMNWENPQTYNEKLNWEKIHIHDERKTRLADKYLVRNFIKEKIGEEYQTKLYGVWNSAEEIDFDSLPERFVLKVNNGSSRNIVVTNKAKINKDEICNKLNEWRNNNYFYVCLEKQYKNIIPKIICEEYLEGVSEHLYDYNIFCFHGEPKYIWCISGNHKDNCKGSFYNLNWEKQSFSLAFPIDDKLAPKPKNLEKMIACSRILAKEFTHVRIDWYEYPNSKNGFLFSEMTFSTWGGNQFFVPDKYDKIFGEMI